MSRLTLAEIPSLREKSESLSCSVAPYTSSQSFKSSYNLAKPKSKTLEHHFSNESRNFSGSSLKKSAIPISSHHVVSLGTGRPASELYPWSAATFHERSFRDLHDSPAGNVTEGKHRTVDKQGEGYNLALALNYGHAAGSPQLVRFLTEHVELVHNPPYADWGTCLTCGSTSAIEIAFRIFLNRGDTVLTEQYTYPGAVEAAGLVGARIQGVELDVFGIKPHCLDEMLRTWDCSRGAKPVVLYTIPTGQNPTGATQSVERKKAIYELAEKHDLIILEDDPYYFLHMESDAGQSGVEGAGKSARARPDGDFVDNLLPSYLSLDRSGRVIRLDSTSKILAPGLRAGWVTASAQIIDKFLSYHEVGVVAVSGPTQIMLFSLLDQSWGHHGFFSWLQHLSQQYHSRRDITLKSCNSYLPKKICRWTPPAYGMFIWISLDWRKHPQLQYRKENTTRRVISTKHWCQDTRMVNSAECAPRRGPRGKSGRYRSAEKLSVIEARILSNALASGVQVTKGSLYRCDKKLGYELHFRLTFAAAPESELDGAVKKFANVIKREFKVDNV